MNKSIIIGSRAFKYYGLEIRPISTQTDVDLVMNTEPSTKLVNVDFIVNKELYDLIKPYCTSIVGTDLVIPDVSTLFTIKLAHMNHNYNWSKHLFDLQKLDSVGTKINTGLFNLLYGFWNKFFPIKPIKLNVEPDSFFNMVTPEQHEFHHDWFKFGNKPIYSLFLKENHEVMVDRNKFFSMSYEKQINSLWEESFVIAHERQIPLLKAIQKVLCDLSKGFWNEFQVLHLVQTMKDFENKKSLFTELNNSLLEYKHENNL